MIIGIQHIHLLSDGSIAYFPNTNKGGVTMGDWLHTFFGNIPGKYEGDADQFLATCNLVDEEVKEAIALIMRKCPCSVVFGDEEHKIDATAGGRVGESDWYIVGEKTIAILIS